MAETKIEWADYTFNPWSGCTKVSPACDHCYAEVNYSVKMRGVKWGKYGNRIIAADSMWKQPLAWNRKSEAEGVRRRVFCASLADVFEGNNTLPDYTNHDIRAARIRLFQLIDATPHLDWLLLTKRPELVLPILDDISNGNGDAWSLENMPNVWIGTTVENQKYVDIRIPELLKIPAKVRFLSVEPMLGPIEFSNVTMRSDALSQLGKPALDGISWVIVGGESGGQKARPMNPQWVRSVRDQCLALCEDCNAEGAQYLRSTGPGFQDDVSHWSPCQRPAFFFKQWGEWVDEFNEVADSQTQQANDAFVTLTEDGHDYHGLYMFRAGKRNSGRILDGRTWDELPEAL